MPSRAPCPNATGASTTYTSFSFGKHTTVNTPVNHTKSASILSESKIQSPFSKSDPKRRSLKAVRFAENTKKSEDLCDTVADDVFADDCDQNSVNERLEMSAADVMAIDRLYATVQRKRQSPVKDVQPSKMIPQVPLNIQPAGGCYSLNNDVIMRHQNVQQHRVFNSATAVLYNNGGMAAADYMCASDDERGFRPYTRKTGLESAAKHFRQNTDLWISEFKGEIGPEIQERQMQVLEARYGGRYTAHRAATIIQRAWRQYVLSLQFSKMLRMAKSVENVSNGQGKRRSLFVSDDPDLTNSEIELNINYDDISNSNSPAARHINSRKGGKKPVPVHRSSSLKDHRRSGSWSGFEPIERNQDDGCPCNNDSHNEHNSPGRPKTAVFIQNKLNQAKDESSKQANTSFGPPSPVTSPVPPCPPLKGLDFYPDHPMAEPAYLARDSLYCSVRRPRRMPPRPPQRTVSFLAESQQLNGGEHVHRPISISDSVLPRPGMDRYVSRVPELPVQHEISSPDHCNTNHHHVQMRNKQLSKSSLPPPPPYIPPPSLTTPRGGVVEGGKPAKSHLNKDLGERLPCDSVSSIDSGFRSSCSESTSSTENESVPTSPSQAFTEIPEDPYSYWVSSPNYLTASPDTSYTQATVAQSRYAPPPIQPGASGHGSNCCCEKRANQQQQIYESYQDVQSMTGSMTGRPLPDHFYADSVNHRQCSAAEAAKKKTVRIQLPESGAKEQPQPNLSHTDDETVRRRNYRVGLNLFNINPEQGIVYLAKHDFIDLNPPAIAKFLMGRKGLSKKMIGEYICNLQKPFNLAVLHCMVYEMDFTGLHIDIALRQLLSEIHSPGEAQKIEKMVEMFSRRYIECNQMFVSGFKSPDTIFILSYAMVLLNTDLHNKSIKPERKMKQEDFLRNLRAIDAGADVDADMLKGIYDRIKANEFKEGPDHVSQVSKVQDTITGSKRPKLNSTWRRLVCFCRVSEVADMHKKDKKDSHQRGIFLFNDMLIVTKSEKNRKKQVHQFRTCLSLAGLRVTMFRTQQHQYGVQLQSKHTSKVAATFACRSYNDQQRFVADLQESIAEVEEMERARLFC